MWKTPKIPPPGGGGVLFGLYNTPDEHLFLKVGAQEFHFSDVAVSTAIKTLLKSNGINLDFDLAEVEIGKLGKIGALAESVMPLLSSVFDKVEKSGNDYTLTFTFSKVYGFLKDVLQQAKIDLDAVLPEVVKNALPKEMTFQAVLKTNGTILTGLDVLDAELTTNDGTGDGTFNLRSNFNLFGAPADALDIAAMVPENLKDEAKVPVTKIFNVNTHGEIVFEKKVATDPGTPVEPGTGETPAAADPTAPTTEVTRTIGWKLVANLDLFRLMEKNFVFDDAAFQDNFLHFQLSFDGEPVLDLAYDPEELGTTDMALIVNVKTLFNELLPDVQIQGMGGLGDVLDMFLTGQTKYMSVPVSTTALGYMLSGTGGKIEIPLPAATWYQPGYYESAATGAETAEPGLPAGIEGILGLIGKVVAFGTNAESGAKEMTLDVKTLLGALTLDPTVSGLLDAAFNGGESALFTNNVFEFAKAETASYDMKTALKTGMKNTDGTYEQRLGTMSSLGIAQPVAIEYITNNGFLQVSADTAGSEILYNGENVPISVEELNGFIGTRNALIRFNGTDVGGNPASYASGSFATIQGYVGLDPTKIGVRQTVRVIAGFPDLTGMLNFILGGSLLQIEGFDLAPVQKIFNSLKLGVFEADVILGTAKIDAEIFDKSTGAALDPAEVTVTGTKGPSAYGIRASISYLPNAAFPNLNPETPAHTVVRTDASLDKMAVDPTVYKELALKEFPFLTTDRGLYAEGDVPVTFVYRGIEITKTYRFAPIENKDAKIQSGKDFALTGQQYSINDLKKLTRLTGTYFAGNAEKETAAEFYIDGIELEFLNVEAMTGVKPDALTDTAKLTFAYPGVAEFRVRFDGKEWGTARLTILSKTGADATVSDVTYVSVMETGKVAVNGFLTVTLAEANTVDTKIAFERDSIRANTNLDPFEDGILTVGGDSDTIDVPAGETTLRIPFRISNLPKGTDQVSFSFKYRYADQSSVLETTEVIALYTGFEKTGNFSVNGTVGGFNATVSFVSLYDMSSEWERYSLQYDATKGFFFRKGFDASLDVVATVEVVGANGSVIADGLDGNKILKTGTLKVTATFDGVEYTGEWQIF